MEEVEIIKNEKLDLNVLANYFLNELSNKITEQVVNRIEDLFQIYNPPKEEEDVHLTIQETCKLVKKSRVTLNTWRNKNLLKPIAKSGVTPLYSKKEVLSFLKDNQSNDYNFEN